MYVVLVILVFCSVLSGMAAAVMSFGTGVKRARIFDHIYYSMEDVDGMGVVYTRRGDCTAAIAFRNPVVRYRSSEDGYRRFMELMEGIIKDLGEGYCIQKQDIIARKNRSFVPCDTFLFITQEQKKSGLLSYDASRWKDFLKKTRKVYQTLSARSSGCIGVQFLSSVQIREYVDRFYAQDFSAGRVDMGGFSVGAGEIRMGGKTARLLSLLDIDHVGLPCTLQPSMNQDVDGRQVPVDIVSALDAVPGVQSIVYNQVLFIPSQHREKNALEKKVTRFSSIPTPSAEIAVEGIQKVQNVIEHEGRLLVHAHYGLVVCVPENTDADAVVREIERIFWKLSVRINRRAYSQLELFVDSFPGNSFALNAEYDRFLMLSDAALCLMYKERRDI